MLFVGLVSASSGFITFLTSQKIEQRFSIKYLSGPAVTQKRKQAGAQVRISIDGKSGCPAWVAGSLTGLERLTAQAILNDTDYSAEMVGNTMTGNHQALWLVTSFQVTGGYGELGELPLFIPELFGQQLVAFDQLVTTGEGNLVQAHIQSSGSSVLNLTLLLYLNPDGNLQINAYDGHINSVDGVQPVVYAIYYDVLPEKAGSSRPEFQTMLGDDDGEQEEVTGTFRRKLSLIPGGQNSEKPGEQAQLEGSTPADLLSLVISVLATGHLLLESNLIAEPVLNLYSCKQSGSY